jgi:hypothetical protein
VVLEAPLPAKVTQLTSPSNTSGQPWPQIREKGLATLVTTSQLKAGAFDAIVYVRSGM